MIDLLLVTLFFVASAGLIYFGGYWLIKVRAEASVVRSSKPKFLLHADVNDDYLRIYREEVHNTDALMLDWYLSNRIRAFLGDTEEISSRDVPENFLSHALRATRASAPLPAVASITAAAKALRFTKAQIALNEDPPTRSRAVGQTELRDIAGAYVSVLADKAMPDSGVEQLNLSEIASFSRLCIVAGLDTQQLLRVHDRGRDLYAYIDDCQRAVDDKFIGYAVKRAKTRPCSCGTFFWNELIDPLGLPSYPRNGKQKQACDPAHEGTTLSVSDYQNGLNFLLHMTYDEGWGGFSAYPGGIPTLLHTELAMRLLDDLRDYLEIQHPGSLDKTIDFVAQCGTNGGFGLFPRREFDLHATKSAIAISRIVGKIQNTHIDIFDQAGISKEDCLDSVRRQLREVIQPLLQVGNSTSAI
jgi:hypothetical protein